MKQPRSAMHVSYMSATYLKEQTLMPDDDKKKVYEPLL